MARHLTRKERRVKRHLSLRKKLSGGPERPRLCVCRTLKHTYAQLIDDTKGATVGAVSTIKLADEKGKSGSNMAAAKEVGKAIAKAALEKGFKRVIFDRNGNLYRGRVKAVAEAAREAGLEF